MLYGVVDGTELTNITNVIKVGETGYSYIANKTGVLIAHPDSEKVLTQYNPVEDAKNNPDIQELADIMSNKMLKGETGVAQYFFEGTNRIIAYRPIIDTEWFIAIALKESELLDDVKILNRWMMMLSVCN